VWRKGTDGRSDVSTYSSQSMAIMRLLSIAGLLPK
jgi:hypothetical protein